MHRISIRVVEDLASSLFSIAKSRGISVNALITEIAWDFCDEWLTLRQNKLTQREELL